MYAEVALDVPIARTFDYAVPSVLVDQLAPGHLVQVPFRTGMQTGIILSIRETTDIPQTKDIIARLHPDPVLSERQIALAHAISEAYLTPIGQCIWFLLPAGLTSHHEVVITLLDADKADDPLERALVELLQRRGKLRERDLDLALAGKNWRAAVSGLVKVGALRRDHILMPPRTRPKTLRTAALAVPPQAIGEVIQTVGRSSKRADALDLIAASDTPLAPDDVRKRSRIGKAQLDKLIAEGWIAQTADGGLTTHHPREVLAEKSAELRGIHKAARVLHLLAQEREPVEIAQIYAQADVSLPDLKRMEAQGLIVLGDKEVWRDSLAQREFVPTLPPPLTPEQAAAWRLLAPALNGQDGRIFLLHGVTGSGKTELYLRAIEATLARGRSAIYLVPEIALTAQTVRRVAARFPGQVAVVHSQLSDGERFDTWRRARQGLFRIAIGPRSALFTPLEDVGLVILDEEHDHSYKQSGDQRPPHYHTRDVAEMMMRSAGGVLILGSATPAVETLYRCERGEIMRLELASRILGHRLRIHEQAERAGIEPRYQPGSAADAWAIDLPTVQVVDMRSELKAGNTSIFSRPLQDALDHVLARREQALLLMNRRGQASYVFCRDCGYVASCPRCDTPLTFHRIDQALRCHRCNHSEPQPIECPQCRSKRIRYFGAGTQQVEEAVKDRFPDARVIRWDADSAAAPGAHETILQHFIDRYADIVVGTQMIAKGLDLPLVTLVGIISADVSLNLPDFRAAERTFQLLTQAAGRAGRGLLGGHVILQTYQPDHYAIQAAAQHDSLAFYAREIAYRRELGYPPFRRLVRLIFRFPQETRAQAEAQKAAALFRERIKKLNMSGTELIGPAPCFFTRVNDAYRWHLLLRGPNPIQALIGLDLPPEWHLDVDPIEVL